MRNIFFEKTETYYICNVSQFNRNFLNRGRSQKAQKPLLKYEEERRQVYIGSHSGDVMTWAGTPGGDNWPTRSLAISRPTNHFAPL